MCVCYSLDKTVKNKKLNQGKQRYLCKEFGRLFVGNPERRHYFNNLKKIIIKLYTNRV